MSTPSHSELLRWKVQLVKPSLDRVSARMWSHHRGADVYAMWLATLHGMIRATVPLMLTALDECLRRSDDPVADELGTYLARHIKEELGHDDWAAEDLRRVGEAGVQVVDLDEFVPGPEIAALVGSQYYWIKHVHPVALAGHMAVLEGYPPSPDMAGALAERYDLPLSAFDTIDKHATLDVRHSEEIMRMIDRLPLDERLSQLVGMSALVTADGVARVMEANVLALDSITRAREAS